MTDWLLAIAAGVTVFLTGWWLHWWQETFDKRERIVLDILPVCACGHPDIPGPHGPDWCDWGDEEVTW